MAERDSDDDAMESMFPPEARDDDDTSDDEMEDLPEQIDDINISTQPNIKTLEEIIETQDDTDMSDNDDDDDDDDEHNEYIDKFTKETTTNYIQQHHQECLQINYDEMETLTNIVRDVNGNIIDALHRTSPILSKYEYSRILGQRAAQIESGSKPYIQVDPNIIDGYIIALQELREKKIPIIIRRPLGKSFEYWRLKDLEIIF
jgi:DNA-directed RNA polymerase I, II, and III subunit RPABC2